MSKNEQLHRWVASVISTYHDLRDLRSAVGMRLKELGFEAQLFEEPGFPVEVGKKAHESCLFAINHADIVVVIIDKRYGGLFLGRGPYSITEEEYHEAIKTNKVVIPCVRKAAWQDYERLTSAITREIEKGRSEKEAKDQLSPQYLEEWRVFDFLRRVTSAPHDDFLVLFDTVHDLIQQLEGRITGLSLSLCRWIMRRQVGEVMSQKTTTALEFSLGDVLKRGYFVEPPYEVISGMASHAPAEDMLKDSLARDRSVLVLGEPGSGKSTIVAKVFLDSAKAFADSHSDSAPLYVNLRGRGASYHFTGKQFIEECCAQFFQKSLPPLFDMSKVKPIYFMDGLDELTEDVTALNIDQVAEKDLLTRPFVISCRSRFAEDSLVSHRFGERVDIVIRMTDWRPEQTWEYIKKFCKIRGKPDLLMEIEQAYKESKELAELLHNPLLLTLFLWIVEESGMALPLGIRDRTSVLGEVIRLLVTREMSRSRPGDSPDRGNVERAWKLAAWETYRARLEDEEMTVSQLRERVESSEATVASLTGLPLFLDLLDTNPHSGYVRGMIHEVLWEYLVGSAIADGVKENRYPFPKCLQYVNRVEINRFVRELWARETMETQLRIVDRLKDTFAQDSISQDPYANLRRSHAAYYIGRLPLKGIVEKLKALDMVESDIMVKLSISFGLVKLGDFASEEKLWLTMDTNKAWDEYNRGYHLVYYRDWSAMRNPLPYIDHGMASWDRTFGALFRHLTSDEPKHIALRRIELLTMRRFIETRHTAGPLTSNKMDDIRIGAGNTPEPIAGFRNSVLREFERLFVAWKSVTV